MKCTSWSSDDSGVQKKKPENKKEWNSLKIKEARQRSINNSKI